VAIEIICRFQRTTSPLLVLPKVQRWLRVLLLRRVSLQWYKRDACIQIGTSETLAPCPERRLILIDHWYDSCVRLTMRVPLTFYKNFSVISITVSIICCVLVLASGSPYFTVMAFWMKFFSNAGLLAYVHLFRADQFTFFANLGYSQKQLYLQFLAIDFTIWIILNSITLMLR